LRSYRFQPLPCVRPRGLMFSMFANCVQPDSR
jgi:hypothetical protein